MEKAKRIKKCQRGQKLCKNDKCRTAMPIHTQVCKKCGFLNQMKKREASKDESVARMIASPDFQIEGVNRKTFLNIRDFLLKSIFEVSFFYKPGTVRFPAQKLFTNQKTKFYNRGLTKHFKLEPLSQTKKRKEKCLIDEKQKTLSRNVDCSFKPFLIQLNEKEISLSAFEQITQENISIPHKNAYGLQSEDSKSKIFLFNLGKPISDFDSLKQLGFILFFVSLGQKEVSCSEHLFTNFENKFSVNPSLLEIKKNESQFFACVLIFNEKSMLFIKAFLTETAENFISVRLRKTVSKSTSGKIGYYLCILDKEGNFGYFSFEISSFFAESSANCQKKLLPFDLALKPEASISEMPGIKFTCFDILEPEGTETGFFKAVLGSSTGDVFAYVFFKGVFQLCQTFNQGRSFFVSDVKYHPQASAPTPITQGRAEPGLFEGDRFATTTLDGLLKIFCEDSRVPLVEIAMQNRPLRSLHWDLNECLLFFLDESEPSLLTAVNFAKPIETFSSESAKRSVKLGRKVAGIHFNLEDENVVAVSLDGEISIGRLPVK